MLVKYWPSDIQVEVKTRKILQDVMYYHMDGDELHKVFNKLRPEGLPDHLGSNLVGDLQTWLKQTYAPAHTALQIAENFNTKDWTVKFTKQERKKILHFWQGSVCHWHCSE